MDTKLSHVSKVPVSTGSPYPPNAEKFSGRHEARLARSVGLTQLGGSRVTLEPGAMTALRHWHEAEDEFVYVLTGEVTLIDDNGEHPMRERSFAGFPAGQANAHHLVNRSAAPAMLMVVGSRKPGAETIHYPVDDLGPIHK